MEHLSRVPKDRIAVLIGKSGKTRKMIEEACEGDLSIDSKTGDVSISWKGEPDPIRRMKAPEVISAIDDLIAADPDPNTKTSKKTIWFSNRTRHEIYEFINKKTKF